MKVRLIRDCTGPNPQFNPRKPVSKENPFETARPNGLEIESPDAWLLCVGSDPVAVPIDDEARQRVEQALERRSKILQRRFEKKEQELTEEQPSQAPARPRQSDPE